MDTKVQIQSTPNPNALKFVLNIPLRIGEKASYKSINECGQNPLAKALFGIDHVAEVYFFDNYITITQDGQGDWDQIEDGVTRIILENIALHDPNFKMDEPKQKVVISDNPEITKINDILDQTVRPALQMDGGDLTVISLEKNLLLVSPVLELELLFFYPIFLFSNIFSRKKNKWKS